MRPPEPHGPQRQLEGFNCGNAALNRWLQQRALTNERQGVSRTVVLCPDEGKLSRFLLRGLRIGASTVSIVEHLRNEWSGGISAGGPGWCSCRWNGGCRPSTQKLRIDERSLLLQDERG